MTRMECKKCGEEMGEGECNIEFCDGYCATCYVSEEVIEEDEAICPVCRTKGKKKDMEFMLGSWGHKECDEKVFEKVEEKVVKNKVRSEY